MAELIGITQADFVWLRAMIAMHQPFIYHRRHEDPFADLRIGFEEDLHNAEASLNKLLDEFLESLGIINSNKLSNDCLDGWPSFQADYLSQDIPPDETDSYLFGQELVFGKAKEKWTDGGVDESIVATLACRIAEYLPLSCGVQDD